MLEHLQLVGFFFMQSISMKQIKAEVSIIIGCSLCMALVREMWPQTVRH